MRSVVLLELDQVGDAELALERRHVGDVGAAKRIDALVVVAHGEHRRLARLAVAGQQLQPLVLQRVGVLELVDQQVSKAQLVVLAQQLVGPQQLEAAQQQFGEIDHALALALRVVLGIELSHPAAVVVGRIDLAGA